ncbi:GGDEF domain-containing protein [Paucibacter sp. Y2R2-4]|uniref:GGDEF domain-containing protein n=1 Tax=Paucibacter sp. Y2R2-4 TaxID=2893553 RepID=UPI0021E41F1D|nr:GGDEF domain-containing protein [Paucibacter sp. Y2R2-4]MCV2351569.1 GGDEF domain-containing protein [Paucibacter sp. Y2R2-4]
MALQTPEALALQLMTLHADSPQPFALFDPHDVLCFANEAFCQAFDTRPDGQTRWIDMMRANLAKQRGNVVSSSDQEAWLAAAASRRGKQPFRAFEADLRDGRWIWMSETTHANGWMLCCASDITALKTDDRALRQERDKALRAALTDPLTGISNRRHFMQQLDEQLAEFAQQGTPLALAVLDLDHFKSINDSLGHDAGDQVIRNFAHLLQQCSRRGDGCGRMGGEEFMLLMREVDADQVQAILQRLQDQVSASRPLCKHPERGYSFSAGLALAQAGESVEQWCKRADQALYQAKAQGRNRCVLSAPAQCPEALFLPPKDSKA